MGLGKSKLTVLGDLEMGRKKEEMEVMPLPRGPVKNRSCTDILCLLLFVFCIAGWAGVSYIGFRVRDFSDEKLQDSSFSGWESGVADLPDEQQWADMWSG